MADFFADLASKAGVDQDTAQRGVGAVLGTVQKYLPTETFSKLFSAIPNAAGAMTKAETRTPETPSSGFMSGLAGVAGNVLGGGTEAISTLASQFSRAGISTTTVMSFVPAVMDFLRTRVSSDVVKELLERVPGLSQLAGGEPEPGLARPTL